MNTYYVMFVGEGTKDFSISRKVRVGNLEIRKMRILDNVMEDGLGGDLRRR